MRKLSYYLLIALLSACSYPKNRPEIPFDNVQIPPAPDYSDIDSWISHPAKKDKADGTPTKNFTDNQETAAADVFYIHPTTFNSKENWNQDISDIETNEKTENLPVRHQASIFNGAGRIFAPRYRQGTYGAFFYENEEERKKVFMIAYQDVRNAFKQFLENWNDGRPIIIAGHSQGSLHGQMLLKEFFDGKPLQEKLVAAYFPGWPIKPEEFTTISPCNNEDEIGCLISWNTYQWNYSPEHEWRFQGALVTNPLNWKSDGSYAGQTCSKGAVMRGFDQIYPGVCDAQASNGKLWIHKPDWFKNGAFLRYMKNYHIADYNLFWVDIRENAELRVKKHLAKYPTREKLQEEDMKTKLAVPEGEK